MNISKEKLAGLIDHTYLKQDATWTKIKKTCDEAMGYGFHSVCIPPCFVTRAKKYLSKSSTKVCTVIGFPMGFATAEAKGFEAAKAVKDGADELDMVINIGALKEGRLDYVSKEISTVINNISSKTVLKVIIETALLDEREKIAAVKTIMNIGATFVKTSTGYASGGATVKDVKLIKSIVGNNLQIKAAGGIRNFSFAVELVNAGAARLGCSSSVSLMK